MFNNYYQAVKYLETLDQTNNSRLFCLRRTAELMRELNIKLEQFKFIHVAGTSGKGSTVMMIHNILHEAGKRVGSFYSPHSTTTIERIKVNDHYIAPADFAGLLERIKLVINSMRRTNPYGQPSYFEIILALAFLYFEKTNCRYVVLEVGCGGKFDATNVIERPTVTAITNIGLDHTEQLGKTLPTIARTKAGIIKTGSTFVTTEKRKHLQKIFAKICLEKKVNMIVVAKIKKYGLAMRGQSQQLNANLAAKIGELLGIGKLIIERGLGKATLPCRFEIIQRKPSVVLDGAHNYDKLKATMRNLLDFEYNKLFIIFTLNKNKDVKRIIKMLGKQLIKVKKQQAGRAIKIFLTNHKVISRPCANLPMMYNLFPSALKKNISMNNEPWPALNSALKQARENDLILVTGSFYLAGELRKKWVSEERILKYLTPGI